MARASEDKAKGRLQEIGGDMKEVAGDLTGNPRLKSEGQADRAAGRARQVKGGIKQTIKDILR
ncbi:MAG TPA: CsbD family protein [Azospirillaceae bacterium]|nr:CsbD family protein [Azospirillaceae bacterium]